LCQLDAATYRLHSLHIKSLFDGICSLAFKRLFDQKLYGVWQFLVFFPYHALSTSTAYHLFNYVITVGGASTLCNPMVSPEAWMTDATGAVQTNRMALAEILENNPEGMAFKFFIVFAKYQGNFEVLSRESISGVFKLINFDYRGILVDELEEVGSRARRRCLRLYCISRNFDDRLPSSRNFPSPKSCPGCSERGNFLFCNLHVPPHLPLSA
jgi:hypothetical protein